MTGKDLFPFAVWNIWLNRNSNNHDKTCLSLNLNWVLQLAFEYKFLTEREVIYPKSQFSRITWHKLKRGQFKLNIDDVYKLKRTDQAVVKVVSFEIAMDNRY